MRNILFLVTMLLGMPAFASQWQVDTAASHLSFEAEQAGEVFKGGFKSFTPEITLDVKQPEKGSISVTIDMASAHVEGKDRMDSLPTRDWFDVKQFPTATFVSKTITATGSDKAGIDNYLARGMLTVKGMTKPVDLPFSLKQEGANTVARGQLTLNRKEFAVGQGKEWDSDQWIKFPVKVSFEVHAAPVK
jgi:polyisoprenoid-binding protein YceI